MTPGELSSPSVKTDVWANGAAYERYVGRWSRLLAAQFVDWLAVPAGSRWLDVGCGTGRVTETILQRAQPATVLAVDASDGFLELARAQVIDERVRFEQADARSLPVDDASVDVAVGGLMLNFVPQPARAVADWARAVRPGGRVAAYLWDYGGKMQFMRHFWLAAAAIDPAAAPLDEGRRFPFCQPEPLAGLWRDTGLHDVEIHALDIDTHFADFDDFWLPFTGGQGSAPGYLMSLDEQRRAAIRDRLVAALPFAVDGSIPLVARAWAVRGTR